MTNHSIQASFRRARTKLLYSIGHDSLGDYYIDGSRLYIGIQWVLAIGLPPNGLQQNY